MKPTKVRNNQRYRASNQVISKQIAAPITKELRKKYSRRNARIMVDDTVNVIRGEYKGIKGKVSKISTDNSSIAIEGNKKTKLKGDKIDVYIHSSNVVVKKGPAELRKQVHGAVIIRQKYAIRRLNGVRVSFEDNAAVIITAEGELKGTDIKGPVAVEASEKWPRIANLASMVV